MVHGWPTSSYDFQELIRELENDFYIAVIDTPGYGFLISPKATIATPFLTTLFFLIFL
jgi:pimeloyl-ACP methyl ester carboxylesterase|tara:strand:+ start:399 stop:572 length:174 start_codon:yes stop_codon:yes gene_type:complete